MTENPNVNPAAINLAINAIAKHAMNLYELMQPGMVIDVNIPMPEDIIIPNQMPKIRRLLIVKPNVHITLSPKK